MNLCRNEEPHQSHGTNNYASLAQAHNLAAWVDWAVECQQPIQKLTNTAPRFQSSSFRCITSGVLYHSTPHSIDRRLLISKHSFSLQSVEYKTPGANLFTAVSKRIDPVDPAPYAQHRRQVNNKTSTIDTPSAYRTPSPPTNPSFPPQQPPLASKILKCTCT